MESAIISFSGAGSLSFKATEFLGHRISRPQRVCRLCQTGRPGDEPHLVFDCPAMQPVRDRHPNLFEGLAAIQSMWRDDMRPFVLFIKGCLDVYDDAGSNQGRASDQPYVAGRYVFSFNLSFSFLHPVRILLPSHLYM